MRGQVDAQSNLFSYFSPESRVPVGHPLRAIKAQADAVLGSMSAQLDRLYAETGRPAIPPERLLKASLLIALYSVRSDRVFCEMLDYNILSLANWKFRLLLAAEIVRGKVAANRTDPVRRAAVPACQISPGACPRYSD